MTRIESLLSARLFVSPQLIDNRLYFISNMSGHLSLYAMNYGGSVPEPLLPPHLALQNPDLIGGNLFVVLPKLGQIMVMLDHNGDENYSPMLIPITGGFPEPAFGTQLDNYKVNCFWTDIDKNIVYLWGQMKDQPLSASFRANVETGELVKLSESMYGAFPAGHNASHTQTITGDAYGAGDTILFHKPTDQAERQHLFGVPIEQRQPGQQISPNGINSCHFVNNDQDLLFSCSIFSDTYGLGYISMADPSEAHLVKIEGESHTGRGELQGLEHLTDNRYLIYYNIDACDWVYEAELDSKNWVMTLKHILCGQGQLTDGMAKGLTYDKASNRFALSFTTATSPTQIYTIEGQNRDTYTQHTQERVLGLPDGILSSGEDYAFTSFDGLRISARLYRPDTSLGYKGPRPLVYYIHGGPQSQEHPDFAWFSMPLIQFLTLNGFAVFVPNVRGSTGYGFNYMNHVVRDWGGQDRLDHVHAMTEILPKDPNIDTTRSAVVGRSYGGYMTLTLASRHPELWSAAVDMFGPFSLQTFTERVPETWKPMIAFLVGDDPKFLKERSPRTYIEQLTCPMLVIQGKNDPRVWEIESSELVEELRNMGKEVDYLMFEDEGHDILKFDNRVRCYNSITDFFKVHLTP